jgi:hypothetical protein
MSDDGRLESMFKKPLNISSVFKYLPGTHAIHFVRSAAALNVPLAHNVHAIAPSCEEKWRPLHFEQKDFPPWSL